MELRARQAFYAAAYLVIAGGSVSFAPATAFGADPLDGIWRSQGYGYVFTFQGPALKAFEVTRTTCVPGFTATRLPTAGPDRDVTFTTTDRDVFFVRPGGDAAHQTLHFDGSASDMSIDRLPRLPPICDHPTPDTPLDNFEVFTRTWAENYISFDLKGVNWDSIVSLNRSKVAPGMPGAQLFDLFEAMIKPFGDAHTFINAPKLKRRFRGLRPGTDRVVNEQTGKGGFDKFQESGMRRLFAITNKAYLHGPLRKFCNDQIEYGHIGADTGYLRIVSFSGYSKQAGFATGSIALQSALDEIFSDSALKALVIDVRINFGGDDPYGLEIASRLATGDYLGYTKQARLDPVDHNQWTPRDQSIVRPSSRPGFRGPVVELTGPLTISAGETFTQALMGRMPRVIRIGENTQGVFSDVLGRRLPNGWRFALPNEVYLTPEEKAFDGTGITPDIEVPVFTTADIAAGRDPALARALQLLAGK
jgi:Peptidase family S41